MWWWGRATAIGGGALVCALAGCGPAEAPDAPPVQIAPQFPPEPPDPWLVDSQVGDLTLIRQEETLASGRVLRVAATFGDALTGLRYPAACLFSERLCMPEDMPFDTPVDTTDAAAAFSNDPMGTGGTSAWLGDTLVLRDIVAPFDVWPRAGAPAVGGYRGQDTSGDVLLQAYPLSFAGGEWGDYDGERVVPLPEKIDDVWPPPDVPIDLSDVAAPYVELTWAPASQPGAEMVLELRERPTPDADPVVTTRILPDDGAVWIPVGDLRLSRPLDIRLFRVQPMGSLAIDPLPADTAADPRPPNTLALRGVAEQGWCLYDTCTGPVDTETVPLVFDFCWSSTSCGESQWFLDPDGTWTTGEGFIGTWTYECCTDSIAMEFSSGTVYSGTRDPDGCYSGEMLSWSGNTGEWRGCFAFD
jgi:hypothetical protein